ncbi:hypothetical protein PRUPE_8G024100 [Prunus persica]|uniref:Uncharacterized protein n=1 Tax=Prunus persica TaxID=3760 RepID=A0A251MUH2_PRUPE|nr:hypothetical protein PRUPE_8G024100 [Prunus persica]
MRVLLYFNFSVTLDFCFIFFGYMELCIYCITNPYLLCLALLVERMSDYHLPLHLPLITVFCSVWTCA